MRKVSMVCEMAICVVLLVLAAFLSMACNRLFGPKPSYTAAPSSTSANQQVREPSVCYVFIASCAEQLGGMPALIETTYVSNDGVVQQTQERTDDVVLSLREGEADVAKVLQSAGAIEFPPSAARDTGPLTGTVVLPEYAGASLSVEVALCDATSRTWVGAPDDIPGTLKDIVDAVRGIGRVMPTHVLQPGQRYVRSQPLTSDTVDLLRRAGIVIDISPEQLAGAPLIEKAIKCSCRLIGVPSDDGLYGAIPFSFVQGRSAHVAYGNQVFQIRHLVAMEP